MLLDFNNWLKDNTGKTEVNIMLLDNSVLSPEQAAEIADAWISEKVKI